MLFAILRTSGCWDFADPATLEHARANMRAVVAIPTTGRVDLTSFFNFEPCTRCRLEFSLHGTIASQTLRHDWMGMFRPVSDTYRATLAHTAHHLRSLEYS